MNSSNAIQSLLTRLGVVLQEIHDTIGRGGSSMERAYKSDDQSTLITLATAEYESAKDTLRVWSTLAHAAVRMADAVHQHALGELSFSKSEFEKAEEYFCQAAHSASAAIAALTAAEPYIDVAAANALLKGYAEYYEIEGIEARALDFRQKHLLTDAIATHEIEISRTRAAATLSPGDAFLRAFFEGHQWYATASLARCKADVADQAGNHALAIDLRQEALLAEKRSVQSNPQWRD